MSSINLNCDQTHLIHLKPLKYETLLVLKNYIFEGENISEACINYQSLAERAADLQKLQKRFEEGTIDLGWRDRTLAIVGCLITAALVGLTVAAVFAIGTHLWPSLLFTPGAEIIYTALLLPIIFTGALFGGMCKVAFDIFKRPSPQELAEELEKISQEELSEAHRLQFVNIESKLGEKIQKFAQKISEAQLVGNKKKSEKLTKEQNLIEKARQEIEAIILRNSETMANAS